MNLSIGLTGLRAAQQAIELIGSNLANAATEGYHRQDILLSPIETSTQNLRVSVGGVIVEGSRRVYDVLIEREMFNILPERGQIEQELSALTTMEAVMGNIDNDPLSNSLGTFYSALSDLSADPTQSAYAQDVVWSADSMCTIFNSIGNFLVELREQLVEQANQWMQEVNGYAQNIAELNSQIELAIRRGTSANLLKDQRDQAIAELAELVDVQVGSLIAEDGQVDVSAWGIPLVMSANYQQLHAGVNEAGELGVSVNELASYNASISGGKIGALASLYNDILPELQNDLNTLARQVMWQFNNLHAQGVGQSGSFTELTGVPVNSSLALSGWQPPVNDGTVCVRLVAPDGTASLHELHVSDTMTVGDVIDQINLIDPDYLSANLSSGAIYMQASNGYKFDFLPTFSDTASAVMETLTGRGVATLQSDYFTGDNPADVLDFDLGSTPAEQFTYTIGNGSKTLYETVQDINAWSQGVHPGWNAASAVWDDAAGGFTLKLNSYDYTGSGNVTVTNTGNVKWSETTDDVIVGAGDFEQGAARTAFGADVALSGIYTGENQTFTCRVVHPDGAGNSGQVGVEEGLTIEVYNEASELVKVLTVGQGYPAGELLEIDDGISISLDTGTLTHGDEFTFTARSESDDTMFLAAAGMNTFFSGTDATNISVRNEFYNEPQRLAACLGVEMGDNANVAKMLAMQSEGLTGLNGSTPDEYYNNIVTTLGQMVLLREARQESLDAVYRELQNQRDRVSGVDANEEAAKLLIYERLFQSMSKFISTQNDMLDELMSML
jgi:flagellar hook-associated protein FlgK